MTAYRKSAPKPLAGSGAAKPKNGLITVIYADDVIAEPVRDEKGVKMIGNFVLKAGANMIQLYASPSSQKFSQEITGEEDLETFTKKLEAIHPADDLVINEFVQNNVGVGVILIFGDNCGDSSGRVLGDVCNPMKLKGNSANDKEGRKNTLMYEQTLPDIKVAGFYNGEITLASNYEAESVDLDLTEENGVVQQLPSLKATDAITASSIDFAQDTIVSLIGGGGEDPATLNKGTQGAVDVILRNGTEWIALKDAVINLKVINGGATTYLVEQSRA